MRTIFHKIIDQRIHIVENIRIDFVEILGLAPQPAHLVKIVDGAFGDQKSLKENNIDDICFLDPFFLAQQVKQMKQKFNFIGQRQSNRVNQRNHDIFHQTLVDHFPALQIQINVLFQKLRLKKPARLLRSDPFRPEKTQPGFSGELG